MSQSGLSDDLAFVRQMAEEGAAAPLLSGRFSVWWGAVVAVGALTHWAGAREFIALSGPGIGLMWTGVVVVGLIGSFLLGRTLAGKPGGSSAGNRASSGFWAVAGLGLVLYWLALIVAVVLRGAPEILFDTMLPVGFLVYAVAAGVTARMMRQSAPRRLAYVSLGFAGVCLAFAGTADIYLVGAIGLVATQVLPGIAHLRAEPKSVV